MITHSRPTIGGEEAEAARKVIESGNLASGAQVAGFEQEIIDYLGVKYAAAVNSGTSALQLAIESLGLRGKEIILPSYSCNSVAFAVLRSGNIPRFADCGKQFNVIPENVVPRISSKTGAIIVAHMHGFPAPVNELRELCEEKDIFLIEDCAQSIGAECSHRMVGSFGHVSCFSFYATKMITTGEGGMVVSNDSELVEKIKQMRSCDWNRSNCLANGNFDFSENTTQLRGNFKMTDFQAALGRVQLKKLKKFIEKRRQIAAFYSKSISGFELPVEPAYGKSVFYRYLLCGVSEPEKLVSHLFRAGIASSVLYPALHELQFVSAFLRKNDSFANTEKLIRSSVSLPIYPSLSEGEQEKVISAVCKFSANR